MINYKGRELKALKKKGQQKNKVATSIKNLGKTLTFKDELFVNFHELVTKVIFCITLGIDKHRTSSTPLYLGPRCRPVICYVWSKDNSILFLIWLCSKSNRNVV